MSAQDKIEKVLRQLHVILSKSEPYKKEPSKVIVDKQEMLDLLAELNKCMYSIMDEYELTQRSRDKAEREFRKRGDEIVWDASRKAEDIYAASVMYTDEALNRVWDIMHGTSDQIKELYEEMDKKLKEQEKMVKTNQLELKSQLQDLVDTEKYLTLIDERNREIKRQKEAGKPKSAGSDAKLYANRQTEVKVNTEYLVKLGLAADEEAAESQSEETSKDVAAAEGDEENIPQYDDLDLLQDELEKEQQGESEKEVKEKPEGIAKMWKNIRKPSH